MKQPYLVLSQRTFRSHNHGQPVTEIVLIGCRDRCQYKTYIDIQNKNYKFWQHIILNPDSGFALSGLTVKDADNYLINADSRPNIDIQDNKDHLFADLQDIWLEEIGRKQPHVFKNYLKGQQNDIEIKKRCRYL
jgi:hypothetical protein